MNRKKNVLSMIVNCNGPKISVNKSLYGIFFEEINHAGEGGIYAEMVQNRNFEANSLPEGASWAGNLLKTPNGWFERKWFNNELPGWELIAEGGAVGNIKQVEEYPLNQRNPHSMRFTARKTGKRIAVANIGYWGMNFRKGESYDLSFYARTEKKEKFDLQISLESQCGHSTLARQIVKEAGGEWKKYSCTLVPNANDPRGRLVIELKKNGTIWFDVVSLFPRNTFKNRPNGLRMDLVDMLKALKPGFLRFPGGCIVEGVMMSNRFQWKDSIGDIAGRRGNFNLWGYYSSNGLGFHEYLQLCEDLNAEAMYVINAGLSCQFRKPEFVTDPAKVQEYVQETLDALEYAMGPEDSKWGSLRARNGHPLPFKIKYVEIGNENHGPQYQRNYRQFYNAIRRHWPEIIIIADSKDMDGHPMGMRDDHYYNTPKWFFDNAGKYDSEKREGQEIYVGEYACNCDVGQGNFLGALSEAAFMIGMERNADIVKLCSYAPLFVNVNDRAWPVNLIEFDSSSVVGRSSYLVQKLFAENRPDEILNTNLSGNGAAIFANAGIRHATGEIIIKMVNAAEKASDIEVNLAGLCDKSAAVKVTTLHHDDPKAENTLDDPEVLVPRKSSLNLNNGKLRIHILPYSLMTFRIVQKKAQIST